MRAAAPCRAAPRECRVRPSGRARRDGPRAPADRRRSPSRRPWWRCPGSARSWFSFPPSRSRSLPIRPLPLPIWNEVPRRRLNGFAWARAIPYGSNSQAMPKSGGGNDETRLVPHVHVVWLSPILIFARWQPALPRAIPTSPSSWWCRSRPGDRPIRSGASWGKNSASAGASPSSSRTAVGRAATSAPPQSRALRPMATRCCSTPRTT